MPPIAPKKTTRYRAKAGPEVVFEKLLGAFVL